MKFKNLVYLSDHMADLVKFKFDSKSKEDLKIDVLLSQKAWQLQEIYLNYQSLDQHDLIAEALANYEIAKDMQLSRWHIDNQIQAQFAKLVDVKERDTWIFLYRVQVGMMSLSFNCQVDNNQAFNYQLNVDNPNDFHKVDIDVMEYFIERTRPTTMN
jgi:hypothetical protein